MDTYITLVCKYKHRFYFEIIFPDSGIIQVQQLIRVRTVDKYVIRYTARYLRCFMFHGAAGLPGDGAVSQDAGEKFLENVACGRCKILALEWIQEWSRIRIN